MLARRELSTTQVRDRLERKGFNLEQIASALRRLRHEGALDDRRTAVAYAHTSAHIKMHGRIRTTRELQRLGISPSLSKTAVVEVYDEVDERGLLERALARRLKGRIETRAELGRLYRYLIRQGFDGSKVMSALTARSASGTTPDATD